MTTLTEEQIKELNAEIDKQETFPEPGDEIMTQGGQAFHANLRGFREAAETIANTDELIVNIRKRDFIKYLLPVVRKFVTDRENADIRYWWSVAGNSDKLPIRVFDKNELFCVVPPIQAEQEILLTPDSAVDVLEVYELHQRYNAHQINGEQRAMMELDNEISRILAPVEFSEKVAKNTLMLAKIWEACELDVREVLGPLTDTVDLSIIDLWGEQIKESEMEVKTKNVADAPTEHVIDEICEW